MSGDSKSFFQTMKSFPKIKKRVLPLNGNALSEMRGPHPNKAFIFSKTQNKIYKLITSDLRVYFENIFKNNF